MLLEPQSRTQIKEAQATQLRGQNTTPNGPNCFDHNNLPLPRKPWNQSRVIGAAAISLGFSTQMTSPLTRPDPCHENRGIRASSLRTRSQLEWNALSWANSAQASQPLPRGNRGIREDSLRTRGHTDHHAAPLHSVELTLATKTVESEPSH